MNVAENNSAQPGQPSKPKLPVAVVSARGPVLRLMFDALVALALFSIASMTLASAPTSASPTNFGRKAVAPSVVVAANLTATGSMLMQANTPVPMTGGGQSVSGKHTAWALLGMAFSLLAAMNLAFFRHLRQAYISPRQRR